MGATNPYIQYQNNAVNSADPGKLTLMLYDGLIKNLKLSLKSLENGDINETHNNIMKAEDIIVYLKETLDYRFEISFNLVSLYGFMSRRLMEANTKKDSGIISEVLMLSRELRDVWQQALILVKDNENA